MHIVLTLAVVALFPVAVMAGVLAMSHLEETLPEDIRRSREREANEAIRRVAAQPQQKLAQVVSITSARRHQGPDVPAVS